MKPQILAAAVLCRGGAMMRTRISWTASVAIAALAVTLTLSAAPRQAANARPYFPVRGEWRKVEPAAAGFDKAKLDQADRLRRSKNANASAQAPRRRRFPTQFRAEAPYNTLIGPAQPSARAAEWTDRDPPAATWSPSGAIRRAPT